MNMRFISLLLYLVSPVVALGADTALDRYVAQPDLHFRYAQYHSESRPLYTTWFLDMTSQQWRSPGDVDHSVWNHQVMITMPRVFTAKQRKTAVLVIDGGDNDTPPPRDTDSQAAAMATVLGTPVIILKQIPNQPLVFAGEQPQSRSEDALIAYTLNRYLRDPLDETWPAHLPMTKAVVRAMDTAQQFLAAKSIRIDRFILTGGSKRGWTAWLAAAVDPRVKAIAPASIDFLNLGQQIRHQCEAYGFYPEAIRDYAALDVLNQVQTPAGAALTHIIDPFAYRQRYTMPKFMLNAAGDQYFMPDSSQFYFGDLPQLKWLRYSPNTDHAQNTAAWLSGVAWAKKVLDNKPLPRFEWTYSPDSSEIRVKTLNRPSQVKLWTTHNPDARDFRLMCIGDTWRSRRLRNMGGGRYVGQIPKPPQGWSAAFIELTYASTLVPQLNQVYTTDVFVTPDTLPFPGIRCMTE
ncbi:MAG: PhoPQ-activated pathogenicity-related family protein [Methylococcaceae bacterium]|nr:PhoPQ-activated pathogenicity-related family protein [Methylococcaceae bacterium]